MPSAGPRTNAAVASASASIAVGATTVTLATARADDPIRELRVVQSTPRRPTELYFVPIGYVTQPKPDKRDEYFVRAEVTGGRLGIRHLYLPNQAVRDYFVQQGISSGSVEAHGFGKTAPIASNDTPEGRQQNRRVELVLSGDAIGNSFDAPSSGPATSAAAAPHQ